MDAKHTDEMSKRQTKPQPGGLFHCCVQLCVCSCVLLQTKYSNTPQTLRLTVTHLTTAIHCEPKKHTKMFF